MINAILVRSRGLRRIVATGLFFTLTHPILAQDTNLLPRTNLVAENFADAEVLQRAGRQIANAAAVARPAVVLITSEHAEQPGSITEETGSGVLVSSPRFREPFIVTNRHVVAGAELQKIEILLSDGRVVSPSNKIEDPDSDLAVLKIGDPGIAAAQWGDSDNLDIGHFVLALGSPFGLDQSVTLGIISAKGRRSLDLPGRNVINQDFLQTDAAINPGNSGGPLVDLNGRVIGINTAIASQGGGNEGIAFAIPSNLVQFVVTQLLDYGRVRRGYLGVELDQEFTLEDARRFSLDRLMGARVTVVRSGSPASRAGLKPDDLIINFDGIDIEDLNDLINRVSLTPVNKQVRVVVIRDGQRETFTVVLAEKLPEQSALPLDQLGPKPNVPYRNSTFRTENLTPDLARQLGCQSTQRGLLVMSLDDASTESGLQLYDVIEEVARKSVTTTEEFDAAIRRVNTGPILLKVRRTIHGQESSRLILWDRRRSGSHE